MTEPRELLDAYGSDIANVETEYSVFEPVVREKAAPKAFAALHAILALAEKDVDEWQAGKDEVHPFHGFSLFNPMYQPRILVSDVEAAIRTEFGESQ